MIFKHGERFHFAPSFKKGPSELGWETVGRHKNFENIEIGNLLHTKYLDLLPSIIIQDKDRLVVIKKLKIAG